MRSFEVAAGEDVGGGEGGGGFDAVEEEDLVLRGDEEDAVGLGVSYAVWKGMRTEGGTYDAEGRGSLLMGLPSLPTAGFLAGALRGAIRSASFQ